MNEGKINLHRLCACVRVCVCVRERLIQQVLWSDSHPEQLSDEGQAAAAHPEPDLALPGT